MEQRTKAALKNKIKIQSNTSSSSALSNLMGMVQCKALDRLREHEEADHKNVETNHQNSRFDDMDNEITKTTNKQITDKNVSNPISDQSSGKDDTVVGNNDTKICSTPSEIKRSKLLLGHSMSSGTRKWTFPPGPTRILIIFGTL